LNGEETKVYTFITRHFLACCSDDAKGQSTTVELDWSGEKFTTSGLVVLERNFLDVYPYMKWETNDIPQFNEREVIPIHKVLLKDGNTSPPGYLTEPELIALMDANGIGTDATMAEHIEKVISREYVVKYTDGGRGGSSRAVPVMIPTTLGIAIVEGYDGIGFDQSLTKPFLRKEMEQMMTKVCNGELTKQQLIDQSIFKYRDVFALASQRKTILIDSVRRYVVPEVQ
jgi:DNA topoisomerase-3